MRVRFALATVLVTSMTLTARADEGMWLVTQIGKLPLKEKGLAIPPEKLFSNDGPCLAHAILNLGGGTGSFVSSNGLVLTNHHVAFDAIRALSNEENNYVRDGFVAKTLGDEKRAQGFTASITVYAADVTADVLEGMRVDLDPVAREKFISDAVNRVTEKHRELAKARDEHLRCSVREIYNGARYMVYYSKTYQDVRLVCAPPAAIGEFGGDPDNWMWPRHCGDFSYMRVYAAPDGSPAKYRKDNVPLKPRVWLEVTTAGVKADDLTFIMGYPGSTNRHRTSFSARYHRDQMLPSQAARFEGMIDALLKQAGDDESKKLELASRIKSLQNVRKNFAGKAEWLKKKGLVEAMQAEEAAARAFVASHPKLAKTHGDIFDRLATLYTSIESRAAIQEAASGVAGNDLMRFANVIASLKVELPKEPGDRSSAYRGERLERTLKRAEDRQARMDAEEVRADFLKRILSLAKLPDTALHGPLEALKGLEGDARREKLSAIAGAALEKTELFDKAVASRMLGHDAEHVVKVDDPVVAIADAVLAARRSVLSNAEVGRLLKEERRRFYEVRQAWKPESLAYPDADRTLRFTYGLVRGYKARDAVTYDYITSLGGAVEKETGEEPFANPPKLIELWKKRDFGNYVDAHVDDVPIAFVHDTDITGGNSGSPVLGADGKMIGIAFDGNWEAITSDYRFDGKQTRTISVDMRYVLFVTEKFLGATRLLEEMGVSRGA